MPVGLPAEPVAGRAWGWWPVGVRGAVAVAFAVLVFGWPGLTLSVLVPLFGAYALVDGLVDAAAVLGAIRGRRRWWPRLVEALVGIGIGVATFAWLAGTGRALPYLVAAWAIANGLLRLYAGVELRRFVGVDWLTMLLGGLLVVAGTLLIVWSGAGVPAALRLVAAGALVFGVVSLAGAYRLYRLERRLAAPAPGGAPPRPD